MHLLTKQSGKMWTQLKSMESLSLLVPMPLRGMWWSRCPWVIMLHSKVHILFLWMPTNLWQHSNRVFLSYRAGSCVTVWNTLILVHLYISVWLIDTVSQCYIWFLMTVNTLERKVRVWGEPWRKLLLWWTAEDRFAKADLLNVEHCDPHIAFNLALFTS